MTSDRHLNEMTLFEEYAEKRKRWLLQEFRLFELYPSELMSIVTELAQRDCEFAISYKFFVETDRALHEAKCEISRLQYLNQQLLEEQSEYVTTEP